MQCIFCLIFTFFQGFIGFFSGGAAIIILFTPRFMVGLAEALLFQEIAVLKQPGFQNLNVGQPLAIFNSAQYFALVLFSPYYGMAYSQVRLAFVFIIMGVLGVILAAVWMKVIYSPSKHPRITKEEVNYIQQGGGLIDMDEKK